MTERPYSHPDPATDAAMDWFIALQDRPGDSRLRADFAQWEDADPRHREAYAHLQRLMALPALRQAARGDAVRLARRRPDRSRGWVKYAAGLAAAVLLIIGILQYPDLMIRWQADHMTAAGEQKAITLPDGSLLRLNTQSAVALDFAAGRRQVRLLKGEAFFDVRPDPDHPFEVEAQFSDITVTGTAFSVREADDEDVVFLARGLVRVSRLADHANQVELTPGQTVAATSGGLSPVATADPASTLAWLEGRALYNNARLADALADLGRYHGSPVVIAKSSLADIRVSGSYRIDDPAAAILTLAEAARARVTRLPGGVIILY